MFRVVIFEPRFTEAARPLGLDDSHAVGMQLDVIANATAKGAGGIFDYR